MIHNSTIVHNDKIVTLDIDPSLKKVGEGLWDFCLACDEVKSTMGLDCEVGVLHSFLLSVIGTVRFERAAKYVTFAEVRELTRLRKIISHARARKGWGRMLWAYENKHTTSAMVVILEEKQLERSTLPWAEMKFDDRLLPEMASTMPDWVKSDPA